MKFLIVILGVFFSSSLIAADVHFYVGAGYDLGGEKVLELDNNSGANAKLYAGQGANLAVGTDIDLSQDVMLRGTVGYKVAAITANDGDAVLGRIPLEFTGYKFFGAHGIGGGIAYQTGIKLAVEPDGGGRSTFDADNTSGVIVEYLYRSRRADSNKGFSIGLRGVFGHEYEFDGNPDKFSANSLGVNLGMTL